MRQIITHFTDNDAYTFSVQYYVLKTYPRAEVKYTFFDRNNEVYPEGFGNLLQEQVNGMKYVTITEAEIAFMKANMYYLPDWYFTFLKGYRFNPNEVKITQTKDGHLHIEVEGKWYSTIMWEMPILSSISELKHAIKDELRYIPSVDDFEEFLYDSNYTEAMTKGIHAFSHGILLSDMGTRRRFSFENQRLVLKALTHAYTFCQMQGIATGALVGTSNVWFAKEFNLKPIGTMSHQVISFEECVSGVFECNYQVMDKWSKCYDSDNGIYLYDCFGSNVFFNNLSKRMAKVFDGLRVDSGDEKEQTLRIIDKYNSLGIDPSTKSIVYSNALTIDKAIELHEWVGGRMKDSYGIGTHLCADVINKETCEKFPYSNIVIKLTSMRITENREWHDCVKLSCDKGKTLGNKNKCQFLLEQIENGKE